MKELNPLAWENATKTEHIKMVPSGVLLMTKARYKLEGFFPAAIRVITASAELFYDTLRRKTFRKRENLYEL